MVQFTLDPPRCLYPYVLLNRIQVHHVLLLAASPASQETAPARGRREDGAERELESVLVLGQATADHVIYKANSLLIASNSGKSGGQAACSSKGSTSAQGSPFPTDLPRHRAMHYGRVQPYFPKAAHTTGRKHKSESSVSST